MSRRISPFAALSAVVVLAASAIAISGARWGDTIERIDFTTTRVATTPAYEPVSRRPVTPTCASS